MSDKKNKNPAKEAWATAFFIENHLDYSSYPDHVSPPEQVRFIVYTKEEKRYYPCSAKMFDAIINGSDSAFLQEKYTEVLKKILRLIDYTIKDPPEKLYLESLIKIKFKHETRDEIMIPSRLEKRLLGIFLNRTQIEDPCYKVKALNNRRVSNALESKAFKKALNRFNLPEIFSSNATLSEIKQNIKQLEFKRLLALSSETSLWESDIAADFTEKDYLEIFNRKLTGDGINHLLQFTGISNKNGFDQNKNRKKILWLADEAGEVIVDLAIINCLTDMGHKVIICFKEGPLFTKADYHDALEDEIIAKRLDTAFFISNKNLSKNELVNILRTDKSIFVISDGTKENLNFLLTSTTFSRFFKEADFIISRGNDQKRRLFNTSFKFTQDIINISTNADKSVEIIYKPKHPMALKFSHKELEAKAETIICQMKDAKKKGMTVIFYSGIIGSIPGKIETAKKIMSVFIQFLKKEAEGAFIINPSEYYEPGMDADDLMYMWEIVQRSGIIDTWRFQTYNDIARAFKLMEKQIPPEWVGKDATFSTGCTKEMKIAEDVLQKHPEMQIIGPGIEKFMRRNEYAVGKMFDKRLC